MGTLGRNVLSYRSGYDDSIIAAGDPEWMFVGASVDWTTVTAVTADTTLPSGRLIKAGQKYLRNGQSLTRMSTSAAAATATLNNTPTGGTMTFSFQTPGYTYTTPAQAYNVTGATIQTALRALDAKFAAATVTGAAGGPMVFGFPASLGSVQVSANGTLLTGAGAQPTITFSAVVSGRNGWFGPYDPGATDGRQTLTRGDIGLVERTVVLDGSLGLMNHDDEHLGLLIGGHMWDGKVLHSGIAAHTLAAGPTRAELLGVLPDIVLVKRTY